MHKIYIILIILSSLSSLRADNHANFEKAKKNREMAIMFFDKLLTEPDSIRPILHKDFTFTYMGKIPDTLIPYGVPYDVESFYSKFLPHIPKLVPDGIELKTTNIIADENGVAVRQKGKAKGKYGPYNNDYSWLFKFKEGKILSIEEFNSDFLVAKSLYGKVLRKKKKKAPSNEKN